MRRRHIWRNGEWVDVTDWKRPPRKTPYIVRDSMDAAVHPVTGEVMDSKSAFRAVTKAHGLVEVGNEALPAPAPIEAPAGLAEDVAQAWQMLEQGHTPPPVEAATPDTRIYT